jgi:hypothetical protein
LHHDVVSICFRFVDFTGPSANTRICAGVRAAPNQIVADIMRTMRRLACTLLIFLSLFQWSWAGVHAASEVSNGFAHAAAAVDETATAEALELDADCAAQSHCCHPHSVGVPGDIATTHFSILGSDIAEHLALRPTDISSNDIERPKWLPAPVAVAVL